MSPSGKSWGPRLFFSNNYLGSVGVYLVSLGWHWLESLPGFIGLEAQTLTPCLSSIPGHLFLPSVPAIQRFSWSPPLVEAPFHCISVKVTNTLRSNSARTRFLRWRDFVWLVSPHLRSQNLLGAMCMIGRSSSPVVGLEREGPKLSAM